MVHCISVELIKYRQDICGDGVVVSRFEASVGVLNLVDWVEAEYIEDVEEELPMKEWLLAGVRCC